MLGHLAKPRELRIGLAAGLAGVQHVLAFAVVNDDASIPLVAQRRHRLLHHRIAAAADRHGNAVGRAGRRLGAFGIRIQLPVMAQRLAALHRRQLALGRAADGADLAGHFRFGAGRGDHVFLIVVLARGRDGLFHRLLAEAAGERPDAVRTAGRLLRHYALVPVVARGRDHFGFGLLAHLTGVQHLAVLGAGRLLRHFALVPIVYRRDGLIAHRRAAVLARDLLHARLGAGRLLQHGALFAGHVRVRVGRDDVRVRLRIVAARALVLRIALGHTGRRHHGRYHVMAQRRHFLRLLRAALAAGVHGLARRGAGRRRAFLLVLHPLVLGHLANARIFLFGLAATLTGAGIQHVLAFAVVMGDASIPLVAQRRHRLLLHLIAAAADIHVNAVGRAGRRHGAFRILIQHIVMVQRLTHRFHLAVDRAADGADLAHLHGFRAGRVNHLVIILVLARGRDGRLLLRLADGAGVHLLAVLAAGRRLRHHARIPLVRRGNAAIKRIGGVIHVRIPVDAGLGAGRRLERHDAVRLAVDHDGCGAAVHLDGHALRHRLQRDVPGIDLDGRAALRAAHLVGKVGRLSNKELGAIVAIHGQPAAALGQHAVGHLLGGRAVFNGNFIIIAVCAKVAVKAPVGYRQGAAHLGALAIAQQYAAGRRLERAAVDDKLAGIYGNRPVLVLHRARQIAVAQHDVRIVGHGEVAAVDGGLVPVENGRALRVGERAILDGQHAAVVILDRVHAARKVAARDGQHRVVCTILRVPIGRQVTIPAVGNQAGVRILGRHLDLAAQRHRAHVLDGIPGVRHQFAAHGRGVRARIVYERALAAAGGGDGAAALNDQLAVVRHRVAAAGQGILAQIQRVGAVFRQAQRRVAGIDILVQSDRYGFAAHVCKLLGKLDRIDLDGFASHAVRIRDDDGEILVIRKRSHRQRQSEYHTKHKNDGTNSRFFHAVSPFIYFMYVICVEMPVCQLGCRYVESNIMSPASKMVVDINVFRSPKRACALLRHLAPCVIRVHSVIQIFRVYHKIRIMW